MAKIDYKKVFSKLSHIKALSHDHKFDEIVQNIITCTLNQIIDLNPKSASEIDSRIKEIYGISIRINIIQSNLDKLIKNGDVIKESTTKKYFVSPKISEKIKNRIDNANALELQVKAKWLSEVEDKIEKKEDLEVLWTSLKSYLCSLFEQHGIQTLNLLNPNAKIHEEDQKSLGFIIEQIIKENNSCFTKEILTSAINQFIQNADEARTGYISQLADSTFTSFALTADAETVNFLNSRYNNLALFLDTNFIFGILDLHKNSEDASARELLEEIKKNSLPFKLFFHPETLAEFKRVFDKKAMFIRATKWTKETSKVALAVGEISPLEHLFHMQNVEHEIDPAVFLDKYSHVDLILEDLGLNEYLPKLTAYLEHPEIEADVDEYQKYYESTPHRKIKYYPGFKHDIVVLREVRSLNPKKSKFLESKSFFISSDYVLGKFERKYYKKNWEISYVVSPSVFLQLIRPFIHNDYFSNKRFIDTFLIPEFRAFEIDYSTTRSKALQILNDSYHDTSFETKVKILRDQVLLEKLDELEDDYEKQSELIENHIAMQNKILAQQKTEAENSIKEIKKENWALTVVKDRVETEVVIKDSEIIELKNDLKIKTKELNKEKQLRQHQERILVWKENKEIFVDKRISEQRTEYYNAAKHCIRPIITLLLAAIGVPLLSKFYEEIANFLSVPIWTIITFAIILVLLAAWDLVYRTYLADKEKIKNGLQWIGTFNLEHKKLDLLREHKSGFISEYETTWIQPTFKEESEQ